MPSTSKAQHKFMAAVAHSPAFAKKVGVPQSVGRDFTTADKNRKFSEGGIMATKPKVDPRVMAALMARRQAAAAPPPAAMQRPMPPQGAVPPQGMPPQRPPGMKKGGAVDGVAKKGKTKGRMC